MTTKEFLIKSFVNFRPINENGINHTVQQKLKTMFKCYTVFNFKLNKETKIATFRKRYRINGILMDDPKTYSISFTLEKYDDEHHKLTMTSIPYVENENVENNNDI